MTGSSLAAFVITYERTQFVLETISWIRKQDSLPSRILLVDNSHTDKVLSILSRAGITGDSILSLGNNFGPAGAARVGLRQLVDEGFDWIYWGDDDDPPTEPDTFSRLLEIARQNPSAGIVGKVGGRFIANRARTRVFSNEELQPVTEADYVTGGKQMIVSAKLIKAGVLPNPDLFFGFEELDFCLRAKDAGFSVLIDGEGILNARNRLGKNHSSYRWKGKSFGRQEQLNRQYYSLRNLLYILRTRGNLLGYSFLLVKTILKMFLSLRYGLSYARKFSWAQMTAVKHERSGKLGRFEVFPSKKGFP